MDKTGLQPDNENDIAQEPYKGPSAFITATGQGAVAHYGFAIAGLIIGGAITFIFHHKADALVKALRGGSERLRTHAHAGILAGPKRLSGRISSAVFGHGSGAFDDMRAAIKNLAAEKKQMAEHFMIQKEHGFGQWLIDHTIGLFPYFKERLRNVSTRWTNAVAVGGIAGFLGFVLSPVYYMITGAAHGNHGRRQFERAKEEILDNRVEIEALREKYVATKLELDDLKTAAPDNVRVARDDTPITQHADAGEQLIALNNAAVQKASPVSIEAPRITEPKTAAPPIGNPNWPQKPNMPWWDKDKAQAAQVEASEKKPIAPLKGDKVWTEAHAAREAEHIGLETIRQ